MLSPCLLGSFPVWAKESSAAEQLLLGIVEATLVAENHSPDTVDVCEAFHKIDLAEKLLGFSGVGFRGVNLAFRQVDQGSVLAGVALADRGKAAAVRMLASSQPRASAQCSWAVLGCGRRSRLPRSRATRPS